MLDNQFHGFLLSVVVQSAPSARDVYVKWSKATFLECLGESQDVSKVVEGRWSRLSARVCTMLLDAVEPAVRERILAYKATGNAKEIVFPNSMPYTNQVGSVIASCHTLAFLIRQWPRTRLRDLPSCVCEVGGIGSCVDWDISLPDPRCHHPSPNTHQHEPEFKRIVSRTLRSQFHAPRCGSSH